MDGFLDEIRHAINY